MSSDHSSHSAPKAHEPAAHAHKAHAPDHSHAHASHGHSGVLVCHKCHEHLTEHDHFCRSCGAEVELEHVTCHGCGATQLASNGFCIECGGKIVHHTNKKSLQFFIVLVVLVGLSFLVVMNSITHTGAPLNVFSPDSQTGEEISIPGTQPLYKETSFNTLIFAGEVTHEAKILVPGPTNQRFTLDSVKAFLSSSSARIKQEDIAEIDVYEEGKETNELLGHFVFVNTSLHKNYSFPSKGYTSVGENLWVNWGTYRTLKNFFK